MMFVLNRDFKILASASNESRNTLHYYDDKIHSELKSGVSTFSFTVSKAQEDSKHIQEGNFVTLVNSKGKQLLFTIMEIEEDSTQKQVYCEDIGLDLLNETKGPTKAEAQPIAYYFSEALHDSGWEIGVNEVAHLTRSLEYTSFANSLERLLSICNSFDGAELDFTVDFDGNTIAHQYVNIYKRRGKDTGIRLNAGIDLVNARRTVSLDTLATALYGVGAEIQTGDENAVKQYVDFRSITYDDGRFYQWNGYILDRESNKRWSRYRKESATKGFIVDYYSYDTDSPQELFNRTLSQLKKRCEPAVTYEVEIVELDKDLSIGDTITVVDSEFNPPLYLSARVLTIDESETTPEMNKLTLGNYVLLKPSIDEQLIELQKTLEETRKSWSSQNQPVLSVESTNGEAFFDDKVQTNLNAKILRGGINITASYSTFTWSKKDRLGNTVAGWSRTGNNIAITYADVLDKATFICTVDGMESQITLFNTLTTIRNTVAPAEPQQGQQWIDTSLAEPEHKIYLSGEWQPVTPVTALQFQVVQSDLGSAKSAIEPDAITNTVMGTTTFNAKLAEYATEEALGGYATTGALDGVKGTAEAARDAIENLDFTPYVKTTQVEQLEDSINTKISQSGGVNLLRNSIGWNGIDFWTKTAGTARTIQTPELETLGFGSAFYSPLGESVTMRQNVTLPFAGTHTLSFYLNKSRVGTGGDKWAVLYLYENGVVKKSNIGLSEVAGVSNGYQQFSYTFTTTSTNIIAEIIIGTDCEATISGLMLNSGTEPFQWTSHSTEVYNTNVRMDTNGIQVMGNRDGSRTVITPDEFSGYENGERIFTLNGDTTEVKKLRAEQQFEMAPITIVTIDNASYKGWAFI